MGVIIRPSRAQCAHPILFSAFFSILIFGLWCARSLLHDSFTLATLPLIWSRQSTEFLISPEHDQFDITFSNYTVHQTSASPYDDRVPSILHHISLGSGAEAHSKWTEVRQSCIDMHPGWEAMMWTDENAGTFVAEHFPELLSMWESYRYQIQKIDALRYMALYHYGGVILDMDLQCKRALGPLRRFEFVAPAAHPTGFSIGFMMASKRNAYVGELVRNLDSYNRNWLLLPYPTVMFSTGCHYASTIHTLQRSRADLKILTGPRNNPSLHSLNGPVSTPIFNHLGSSSWHSYDAAMIVSIGKSGSKWRAPLLLLGGSVVAFVIMKRVRRRRRALSRV